MSKPDAPDPPDYVGAADAQGEANLLAAIQSSLLSTPNYVTPFGTQTVSYDQMTIPGYSQGGGIGGDTYLGGTGRDASYGTVNVGGRNISTNPYSGPTGGSSGFSGYDYNVPGTPTSFLTPTITQTLSPEQQRLYEQQTQISSSLNQAAQGGLNQVNQNMANPYDPSGLTQISGLNLGSLPGINQADFSNLANVNRVDTSTLDPRTVQGGIGGYQDVYDALMARESDRFGRQRQSTEADLLARGFNPGTSGYTERVDDINRAENDFSLAARLAAGQEQSRMFGLESEGRQQGLAEMLAQQQSDQGLRGQQTQEQQLAQQMSQLLRQQMLGEQVQGNQTTSNQRAQELQEALMLRQLPLSEVNALRTGSQPMMPSFTGGGGGQGIQPTDILGALNSQYQGQLGSYNADAAQYSNTMNTGASLLGSYLMLAGFA